MSSLVPGKPAQLNVEIVSFSSERDVAVVSFTAHRNGVGKDTALVNVSDLSQDDPASDATFEAEIEADEKDLPPG